MVCHSLDIGLIITGILWELFIDLGRSLSPRNYKLNGGPVRGASFDCEKKSNLQRGLPDLEPNPLCSMYNIALVFFLG